MSVVYYLYSRRVTSASTNKWCRHTNNGNKNNNQTPEEICVLCDVLRMTASKEAG